MVITTEKYFAPNYDIVWKPNYEKQNRLFKSWLCIKPHSLSLSPIMEFSFLMYVCVTNDAFFPIFKILRPVVTDKYTWSVGDFSMTYEILTDLSNIQYYQYFWQYYWVHRQVWCRKYRGIPRIYTTLLCTHF